MMTCRLILTLLLLGICVYTAQGVRGCSNFGHSCFGAHGKRTDASEQFETSSDQSQVLGSNGDQFLTGGGAQNINDPTVSAFIRKWMSSLRWRGNDDAKH